MHINVDGTNVHRLPSRFLNTGGWQTWATVTSPNFTLTAGAHKIEAVFDTGGPNVNYMTFSSVASACGPYGGTAAAIPGTIQAENYDTCGAGSSYSDTTAGNSGGQYRTDDVDIEATADTSGAYDVGWTAAGEWLNYTVNVASAGTYNVQVRVASESADSMHINVDGTNVTGSISIPNTGGWQTWATVTSANFTLTAGSHVIRAAFDTGGHNFNYLTFSSASSCTPTTCSALGATCGTPSNGCGGTLSCSSCTSPQTCGGGGTANVCGGGSSSSSSSSGGGTACATAYSSSNCLTYTAGTIVSEGGFQLDVLQRKLRELFGVHELRPRRQRMSLGGRLDRGQRVPLG